MCREFSRVEAGHLSSLFDDRVDGARFECTCGNIAPAINFSKHAALVDFCCFQPAGEGFDRTAGQIDGFIVIGTTGFGASEMDAERGEGGAVLIGDRDLFDKLFRSQAGNFAAPAPAGGKGYHQDGPIP
ncbi:hypothetical protein D3C80_935980 [compost metagenome]